MSFKAADTAKKSQPLYQTITFSTMRRDKQTLSFIQIIIPILLPSCFLDFPSFVFLFLVVLLGLFSLHMTTVMLLLFFHHHHHHLHHHHPPPHPHHLFSHQIFMSNQNVLVIP